MTSKHDPLAPLPEIERILLLGHSGFIGRHLERFFRKSVPVADVVGRSAPEIDLTRPGDAESLAAYLGMRTAVIVCAGIKRQLGDSLDTFSQNVAMAVNLCRVLQRCPVRRCVFFSSAAVYGEEVQNVRISETTPVHPTSLYAAAKFVSECLFRKVFDSESHDALVILRPPVIYGPGDTGNGYGPTGFARGLRRQRNHALGRRQRVAGIRVRGRHGGDRRPPRGRLLDGDLECR